jgi:C1A family cysteine protease
MTTDTPHRYGWRPDLPDHRDYKLRDYEAILPAAVLPTLVDLRPYDSPIRDQGQLGSCTAFAGEGAFHFEARKQGIQPDMLGSPLFLYYEERVDQGTVGQDSGASIREISKALSAKGICSEATWGYDISRYMQPPSAAAQAEAALHKATQYLSVAQSLAEMKSCLASGFPIMIGFTVYQNLETATVQASGMVPMPQGAVMGGHANLLVGYDDSRQVFISRNSWGTGFGDKGYLYFPYAYLINSGLASDFWTLRLVSDPMPTPTPTPTPTPPPGPLLSGSATVTFNINSTGITWTVKGV